MPGARLGPMNQHIPLTTYRLQFNRNYRFEDARRFLPYLHELGITDLYASPLLQARSGSLHGYDVTDPTRLNPEIGTPEEFASLCEELEKYGMGLLLDIVPNHMSASSENPWWMDVLENGHGSRFASYFDIDWHHPKEALQGKVLLPILGSPFGAALENQELALSLEEAGFFVHYYETRLPVALRSYNRILRLRLETVGTTQPDHGVFQELESLVEQIESLSCQQESSKAAASVESGPTERPAAMEQSNHNSVVVSVAEPSADSPAGNGLSPSFPRPAEPPTAASVKQDLWRLYTSRDKIKAFLDENIRIFNGRRGDPASFEPLDRLLEEQAYWLSFWKLVNEEINYRRFFTISDLVGMRVEDPAVYDATHALLVRLMHQGQVTGLRVDHIDGLFDPAAYLERLHRDVTPTENPALKEQPGTPYIVVEKILASGEPLPREWRVCGTTGYEFVNAVNGVFVDGRGARALNDVYAAFIHTKPVFNDIVYRSKRLVMDTLFGGEMRSLGRQLGRLAEQDRYARDLPLAELDRALVEVTACLPVYRTYTRSAKVSARDRRYVARALEEASRRDPSLSQEILGFLRSVLVLDAPGHLSARQHQERLAFLMRWQQFTGPIMAKGYEDTSLYVYNRLASLNEVGGDPEVVGVAPAEFHRLMAARLASWPYSLNATATHDTKRGEDTRARINVLSEIPARWKEKVVLWRRLNSRYVQTIEGRPAPDANEEYLFYQTLIGAWPPEQKADRNFRERLRAYVIKAAREAKVYTRWIRPDERREKALADFVDSTLKRSPRNRFLKDFLQFHKEIAFSGALNGLGQVLLKIAAPGVADFYQGTELWDLSLVDPDNRRPVDFDRRAMLLRQFEKLNRGRSGAVAASVLRNWENGALKLHVVASALSFRHAHRSLFLEGEYIPLEATGKGKDGLCALARRKGAAWVLAAVPRLLTKLVNPGEFPVGEEVWQTGVLRLPQPAPQQWVNIFTGESVETRSSGREKTLALSDVLHTFPVAMLAAGSV